MTVSKEKLLFWSANLVASEWERARHNQKSDGQRGFRFEALNGARYNYSLYYIQWLEHTLIGGIFNCILLYLSNMRHKAYNIQVYSSMNETEMLARTWQNRTMATERTFMATGIAVCERNKHQDYKLYTYIWIVQTNIRLNMPFCYCEYDTEHKSIAWSYQWFWMQNTWLAEPLSLKHRMNCGLCIKNVIFSWISCRFVAGPSWKK